MLKPPPPSTQPSPKTSKNEQGQTAAPPSVNSPFSLTKAVISNVSQMNKSLAAVAAAFPAVFAARPPADTSDAEVAAFARASTVTMQLFGIANQASFSYGKPMCAWRAGKVDDDISLGQDKLDSNNANISALVAML